MTKLRLANYRDLSKVAQAVGFQAVRRERSHCTFRNAEGRIVVIPDHGSQVIVRPLLRKVLRDIGLNVDEYHDILSKL